ncbi:hypothetical protein COV16_06745 [Candidatus Woesearchaeota archaeon CG10_big_fil_rev_8_21_14_0_10_34_8]|nr:MAG: hypothetical protein COV16_06745 [Candidatus Woesearchaeota archaeon CG10_big_fil_rev_8_21_14_0_10_34_8]
MIIGHKIKEKISNEDFIAIISNCEIYSTNHTFMRLNEKQRKVFKHEKLIDIIRQTNIILAGIQYNGLFTVIFDFSKSEAMRIIFEVHLHELEIVTFYLIEKNKIPRV